MKSKIIIIFVALLLGGFISYYIFNHNKVYSKGDEEVIYVKVKAFQIGVYKYLDNAKKCADRNNGIVIRDNDNYRVYTAILNNNDAINKVSNYYKSIGLNYYIRDISVDSSFLSYLNETEVSLLNSDDINSILFDILKEYEKYL